MSTFLDVVELLLTDSEAKTSYTNNPDGFMQEHGLESFDSNDVADAMQHASDALPLPVAVLVDPANGLDSAASIDLAAEGLTLEREPVVTDDLPDVDDTTPGDIDPDALDSLETTEAAKTDAVDAAEGYGTEVPFDVDSTEDLEGETQPVEGLPTDAPLTATIDEAPIEALTEMGHDTDLDSADSLTDVDDFDTPQDVVEDAYDTDQALDLEDLASSNTEEYAPDDFDLLD